MKIQEKTYAKNEVLCLYVWEVDWLEFIVIQPATAQVDHVKIESFVDWINEVINKRKN